MSSINQPYYIYNLFECCALRSSVKQNVVVLLEGFEPPTTVPKTVVISISPQERGFSYSYLLLSTSVYLIRRAHKINKSHHKSVAVLFHLSLNSKILATIAILIL